jgi:hypothetical protein
MAKVPSRFDNFDAHMVPQRNQPASSGAHCPPVRTNAIPLDTFTDPASLRSHREWDWRTGQYRDVSRGILENAQKHLARLKVCTVTSERTHPDPKPDYLKYGMEVAAAPSVPKSARNRRKAR